MMVGLLLCVDCGCLCLGLWLGNSLRLGCVVLWVCCLLLLVVVNSVGIWLLRIACRFGCDFVCSLIWLLRGRPGLFGRLVAACCGFWVYGLSGFAAWFAGCYGVSFRVWAAVRGAWLGTVFSCVWLGLCLLGLVF